MANSLIQTQNNALTVILLVPHVKMQPQIIAPNVLANSYYREQAVLLLALMVNTKRTANVLIAIVLVPHVPMEKAVYLAQDPSFFLIVNVSKNVVMDTIHPKIEYARSVILLVPTVKMDLNLNVVVVTKDIYCNPLNVHQDAQMENT